MPGAGDLRERVRFESPAAQTDDYGNTTEGWTAEFTRPAMYIMRPGSEAFNAARLEGRQPLTVVVRYDSETSTVTPAWRLVDDRTGRVMQIRSAEDVERRRMWWSMVCEAERS